MLLDSCWLLLLLMITWLESAIVLSSDPALLTHLSEKCYTTQCWKASLQQVKLDCTFDNSFSRHSFDSCSVYFLHFVFCTCETNCLKLQCTNSLFGGVELFTCERTQKIWILRRKLFSHLQYSFESEILLYYLNKIRGVHLCEIFCEVKLDQYDRAIGESLTKLAFDAVEKIINVSLIIFTCCGNVHHFKDIVLVIHSSF